MKNKEAITLVRNGSVVYPYQESDYEKLQAIGCPITNLTTDYLPVVGALAKRKKHKINFLPFEPIEAEMFKNKVAPRWKHGLLITHEAVTISYPKEQNEVTVEKLTDALKRWYRNHFITFDINIKRTAKKVTITMSKVYGQPK